MFYFVPYLLHVLQYFLISHAVVDAYSAWCGPCKAIVSTLKRIKNELGDDLLHFATVSVRNVRYTAMHIYIIVNLPSILK